MTEESSFSRETLADGAVIDGRYRIERRLGQGGMGVVFEATHIGLGRQVAIKVLREQWATEPEVVERLAREARIIAQLDSQHIVSVFDVGQLPSGCPYIVMEYLRGEDLAAKLEREGPLPPTLAMRYVLQAVAGLEQAHARGIVHRDLKPENLFLAHSSKGANEVVKVLDFGISKNRAEPLALTRPTVALGTPHYMAPEQHRASGKIDERTDIWALGVILYEAVTGALPFDGDSLADVCARALCNDPAPPSLHRANLPAALDDLVLSCLAKDPNRRPGDLRTLTTDLTRLVESEAMAVSEADPHRAPAWTSHPTQRASWTAAVLTRTDEAKGRTSRAWLLVALAAGLGAMGAVTGHRLLAEPPTGPVDSVTLASPNPLEPLPGAIGQEAARRRAGEASPAESSGRQVQPKGNRDAQPGPLARRADPRPAAARAATTPAPARLESPSPNLRSHHVAPTSVRPAPAAAPQKNEANTTSRLHDPLGFGGRR